MGWPKRPERLEPPYILLFYSVGILFVVIKERKRFAGFLEALATSFLLRTASIYQLLLTPINPHFQTQFAVGM